MNQDFLASQASKCVLGLYYLLARVEMDLREGGEMGEALLLPEDPLISEVKAEK